MNDQPISQEAEFIKQERRYLDELYSSKNEASKLKQIEKRIQELGYSYVIFLIEEERGLKEILRDVKNNSTTEVQIRIVLLIKELDEGHETFNYVSPQIDNEIKKLKLNDRFKEISKENFNIKRNESDKKIQEMYLEAQKVINGKQKNEEEMYSLVSKAIVFKVKEEDLNLRAIQEYASNAMKKNINDLQKAWGSLNSQICCKVYYTLKEEIEQKEGKSQEFKKYTWPIANNNITNHILKTVVGLMNVSGGVIYIGVAENIDKKNEIVGVALGINDIEQFKKYLEVSILQKVHPRHEGFEQKDENNKDKKEENPKAFDELHKFNDYFEVEFIHVVDPQTLTYCRPKDKCFLYIMKIIVKIGHPKHLYHSVNADRNVLEFFERNDRNVEKKAFPDAYAEIYKRLDKYYEYKAQNKPFERTPFHNNCRYSMKLETDFFKEDNSASDDDEDDE